MGVWSSGRGGEAARRAASALVVSLQESWKGERAGVAMWAVTQERRTVKRETKRREKWLRSCHSLPACQCTCLFSGTRPSKGLNLESVNSYKHSVHVHGLTHTQLYVLRAHALTSHFICRFQVTWLHADDGLSVDVFLWYYGTIPLLPVGVVYN